MIAKSHSLHRPNETHPTFCLGEGEIVQVSVVPLDPPPFGSAADQEPAMKYWLELGNDGQPVNGGWIAQPDFIWSQEPSSFFDRIWPRGSIRSRSHRTAPDRSESRSPLARRVSPR